MRFTSLWCILNRVKLRSSARTLKKKSIASARIAVATFNGLHDDGRVTSVLLHLQHSFEMLIKAALHQARVPVFDKMSGRSIGFEASVRQAQQTPSIKLTDEEAGTLRAIDAMRDDEQHWYTTVDEGLLFLHVRAAITLFDDLLHRVFGERLADHLPLRVLPISVEPPQDFHFLVDREYEKIADLLKPGRRSGAEARARIRALLAMEAHNEPDTKVSDSDVSRVEKGIRSGKKRDQVFPKLASVGASVAGEGLEVEVRFVKRGGLAVTFVDSDSEADAAAIRTVDLQKRFHRSAGQLAQALKMSQPRAVALREHLGIDADPKLRHEFSFGSQRHVRYTDHAFNVMQEAVQSLDMDAIWASHGKARTLTPRPQCLQPDCATRQNRSPNSSAA